MDQVYNISNYVHIRDGKISVKGRTLINDDKTDFKTFIKSAYKTLDINYAKFFKMDKLSKLAFIAAEILLKDASKSEKNIAISLSNKASSLDTDRLHQNSISNPDDYYPSPSVFVYTLPNICIGEICIRHQLFSENSFFIFDTFNPSILKIQAEHLIKVGKAAKVLSGWVDVDGPNYDVFLYLVEEKGDDQHTIEHLKELYLCQNKN